VGEPEFETPADIINITKRALDDQNTRYGPVSGLPELRSQLSARYSGYDGDNIIISNGSKQSLFSVFQVICNPGDEVIIPRPYWVSFVEQVKMAGGKPVFVNTINHQLDIEAIVRAFTAKTKVIIINTPNNPTGAVYPEAGLEEISRLAIHNNVYVVSDEAYDFLIYDELRSVSFFNFKAARDRTIITNSFSKHYNMTGFRIGYVAAHKDIVQAMAKFQGHSSGNVCTFAQYGALAALSMGEEILIQRKAELEKKRDIAYGYAAELFDCIRPQGAFYIFPNITKHLRQGRTSEDFAADLLEKTGVAVVSGEAFGMPGHIRISYATSEDLLLRGFDKISEYLHSEETSV